MSGLGAFMRRRRARRGAGEGEGELSEARGERSPVERSLPESEDAIAPRCDGDGRASAFHEAGGSERDCRHEGERSDGRGPLARLALPAAALAALLAFAILGSVASLGRQLADIHPALGWAFFALVVACLAVGVAWPIARVLSRPLFSLARLFGGGPRARHARRELERNLRLRADLTPGDREALAALCGGGDPAPEDLAAFFKQRLSPVIDRDIRAAAKSAFATTAVSQTAALDMLSMLSVNLGLVRAIVEHCGFRPSALALAGLYARVLKATFLAGGLEEMDLEEVLSLAGGNAVARMPGVVIASAAQGAVNAFATARVGVVTKRVLFAEEEPVDMRRLRRESYGEALSLLKRNGVLDDIRSAIARKATAIKDGAVESARQTWGRIRPGS